MASAPEIADAARSGPIFATLAPAGSNHDYVARALLNTHDLTTGEVRLFRDFDAAFLALDTGQADFVLQVAVHPTVQANVGRNLGRLHLIDAFIAPSQPMAVLTRHDCATPMSIAFMPATRDYVDLSRWSDHRETRSTVDAWDLLAAGEVDSALTLQRFADAAPGRFRIDAELGAPTDAWLVFGRSPLPSPGWSLWRDAPAATLYRAAGASRR